MSTFAGDFLGFQLGQYHSQQLHIVRTSTNDRYIENMLPTFSDSTAVAIGGNGTYYWNTSYTQKLFTIDFAFDDLHEIDVQRLKQVLGFKGLQPLIFDEFPYKKYMVKCATPPALKYICFDKEEVKIYKGEGSIQLISFYPFGFGVVDSKIKYNPKGCILGNNGELESDIKLIYKIADITSGLTLQLREQRNGDNKGLLTLSDIVAASEDEYIKIDSYTNLIEGLDASFNKTKNLYNKYISAGDFFKVPLGLNYLLTDKEFISAQFTPLYY